VISAKTKAGLVAAQRQLSGELSERINRLRERLLEARAQLEANIDFPDEEIGELDRNAVAGLLEEVAADLRALLSTYTSGRLYREGALCVIAGRPNVGKSSLLNRLVQRRRAIVTPTPGTTRDAVEDTANIGGVPFRLVDTAGIREARDAIEGQGVQIAREQIEKADLVVLLCDGSEGVVDEDLALKGELAGRSVLLAVNKVDLLDRGRAEKVSEAFGEGALKISAKTGEGIESLTESMLKAVRGDGPTPSDEAVLTNARHRQGILKGVERVKEAIDATGGGQSPELVALEIADALIALGEIVGQTTPDDVLDLIFSRFCIGK